MSRTVTMLLCLFTPFICNAQHDVGLATNIYNGCGGIYLNPANIADYQGKFLINVAAFSASVDNNVATLNTGNMICGIYHGDSVNINRRLHFNDKSSLNILGPSAELQLPGCLFRVNKRHVIAITMRLRTMTQADNINSDFLRTMFDKGFTHTASDYSSLLHHFNVSSNTWSEIGITYTGILYQKKTRRVTYGLSLRYLSGIAYAGIRSDALSAQYNAEGKTLTTNGDITIASNFLNRTGQLSGSALNALQWLAGDNGGHGASTDFGVNYEFLSDPKTNQYWLKLSASIVDLGCIYYTNNTIMQLKGAGKINVPALQDSIKGYNQITSYLHQRGYALDSSSKPLLVWLPRTINIAADYALSDNYYLNLMFIGNIADESVDGTHYYSQITFTPRYETKTLGAAFPISYAFLSKSVKIGFAFRRNKWFIGSDDLLLLFVRGQSGASIYFGGSVHFKPIKRKKHCYGCETYLNWAGAMD